MDALNLLEDILQETRPSTGQLSGIEQVEGTRSRGGGTTNLHNPQPMNADLGLSKHDSLYNAAQPSVEVIHEKPEHRLIAFLKAEGRSNREVAKRTGYTEAWISQICRQRWMIDRIVYEMNQAGRETVSSLLAMSAADSVITLITLRDDSSAPKAVRKACADSLLDRYLGKPTQTIVNQHEEALSKPNQQAASEELEALKREELALSQQLNDLGS
jgi:hypothetical protein